VKCPIGNSFILGMDALRAVPLFNGVELVVGPDFRAGRSKEPRIFRHFQVEPAYVKPVKILTVVNAVPISIRGD